ncbi:MAG: aldehyde dehydrogenase family protein [Hyphomicrobiaceae bacterium]
MTNHAKFFIDGAWVEPHASRPLAVVNPATEEPIATIALGTAQDVDRAVSAARRAFESYSRTSRQERLELLDSIAAVYKRRFNEMGETISSEMGAPLSFATRFQAGAGMGHFRTASELLKTYAFEEDRGSTRLRHEPIGVAGMITPWNWPANQIACKVAPALATGCTMVLKPSEVAPLSAMLLAEILAEAGVPAGVFNLVNGDGPGVGTAIAAHPGIDMVSFTGSTRAGVDVAIKAAPTVKRVGQELGGKSANILLDDADFAKAVRDGVIQCFRNSGQSCNSPTRMLVPAARMAEVAGLAKRAADGIKVGDPRNAETEMGPVVSDLQWGKIQELIQSGIDEGARLVTGGTGKPDGLNKGYYVRPTVFADVDNKMRIAQEEIFGPVLSVIGYGSEEEAVAIANDSPFGLAAYVQSASLQRAQAVGQRLRVGMVHLNGAGADPKAPFGGYKMSGNGREWGSYGFHEFLEVKAMMGANPA